MRHSIAYKVYGSTISEIIDKAQEEWKVFVADESAELPHDTEINISPDQASDYVGEVFVRFKADK
jgi:phage tail protein X